MTVGSRLSLAGAGLLGAALVLLGGLVTSPLPDSSWASGIPWRATTGGRMLGLVVVMTGLALLAASWIRLWWAAAHGRLGLGDVRRHTALWCLPLLVAPPLFSRDGWSYAAQGELVHVGLSPYVWGPIVLDGPIVEAVDPRWLTTPAPYGPLPLLGGAWAARVLEDPWALVVAHRLLALVGLVLLAWALPHLARWAGLDPTAVSALALPSPLVLAHGVGGLHNDLLLVGLVAAALVATRQQGWIVGALVAGLAAAVKLPGTLAVIGVVLMSLPATAGWWDRVRRFAGAGMVAAGSLLAVGIVAGVGQGWVHALAVPATLDTPLSVTTVVGHLLPGARTIGVLAAFGATCWLALRGPTGSPGGAVRATAAALTVTVVLSPVVHAWYALWCLPLVAACHLGTRSLSVLLWLSFALGLSAPLDSSLEGRPVAIALTSTLVVGTVLAACWWVRPSVVRSVPAGGPAPVPSG